MELEKKLWKKTRRYVRVLKIVPFVRMIAVCNNLAFGKIDERSDIDLFIIARRGRLFTVRVLVTFLLHVLGVRRHAKKVAGRFCLSFFVDDLALDLSEIAIEKDIYLAFWIATMKPLLDDGVSGEFLSANTWVSRYFDEPVMLDKSLIGNHGVLRKIFVWVLNGRFGDWFEKKMRTWQMKRARDKSEMADEGASLIIDEHILKFHNIDRRREYRNQWFKTYGEEVRLNKDRFLNLNLP